jgi:hypothetical protein
VIERHLARDALSAAVSALLLLAPAPALGQPGAKPKAAQDRGQDRGQDKPAPERPAAEKTAAPPVIGCPSLANYRMLMRGGPAAAAVALADPKADHLGCAALPRGRITGTADRVVLGGRAYTCASVQGTTACHWMEAGAGPPEPLTGAAGGAGR